LLGLALGIAALFVVLFLWIASRGGIGSALVLAALALGIIAAVTFLMRPSMEASARYQWWVTPWRGPRERK
jgi:hypothetical protein